MLAVNQLRIGADSIKILEDSSVFICFADMGEPGESIGPVDLVIDFNGETTRVQFDRDDIRQLYDALGNFLITGNFDC